jgi:cyanophycinase
MWGVFFLWVASVRGEDFPQPTLDMVNPAGIRGSLVICGGGKIPDSAIRQFRALAGGETARLVVIPTASKRADQGDLKSYGTVWHDRGFATVEVVHTRDRGVANSDGFLRPLKTASAVWFVGGQQSLLAEAYVGTRFEHELGALLNRGGVVGGTSAGAAIQSRLMIAFGNPQATLSRGLDLVPGAVIDQHFKVRKRARRLTDVLAAHPGYFGLGIDEGTGVIIRGRRIHVVGDSTVTVCFSESARRPALSYEVPAGGTADLTALRRTAIARAAPAVSPHEPTETRAKHGTLLMVGGGSLSRSMWQRFVELAGGPDARIVYVPTASKNGRPDRRVVDAMLEAGAESVSVLHTRDRDEANKEVFFEPLRGATGVWIGGGRQWRLVDAYEGTATCEAFHDVLRRGGVIGGSSAGATIQGDYLVRGHPLGNRIMMAEGYERGFKFLPGVAIDQHFTQRGRQPDLSDVMRTFPQFLGIGIDESTAIEVHDATARVIGTNSVYFYDGATDDKSHDPRFEKLSPGDSYDLRCRIPIQQAL